MKNMESILLIKKEIERRIKERVQMIKDGDSHTRPNDGSVSVELMSLLSFIESLKKEQPQELDEAAREYADRENPTCPCGECLVKTFKAGAEWMAEQGYSQDTCVYYNRFNDETEAVIHLGCDGERGGFKPGDRVIVQIRKINEKEK